MRRRERVSATMKKESRGVRSKKVREREVDLSGAAI